MLARDSLHVVPLHVVPTTTLDGGNWHGKANRLEFLEQSPMPIVAGTPPEKNSKISRDRTPISIKRPSLSISKNGPFHDHLLLCEEWAK